MIQPAAALCPKAVKVYILNQRLFVKCQLNGDANVYLKIYLDHFVAQKVVQNVQASESFLIL